MINREFLQLAHTLKPDKHSINGWYVSEKLDGMRAYWDGGWTKGMLTTEVPFANSSKDYRRVTPAVSTGLWSRYAKPIAAPEWWTEGLPDFPLDGELYMGPGRFQDVISTVKRFQADDDKWSEVDYCVFDLPSDYAFLMPGRINNPQWTAIYDDMRELAPVREHGVLNFHKINRMIEIGKISLGTAHWLPQVRLPMGADAAEDAISVFMDKVIGTGGEGLVLRKPESVWVPKRSSNVLKVKPVSDSEAKVVGYTWGKGKYENMLGALQVVWNNKFFELSGFTDDERTLLPTNGDDATPGSDSFDGTISRHFPKGSTISFKYRELTDAGYPKEARYWRK